MDTTNTQGNIHKDYWLQNLDMTQQTHRETYTRLVLQNLHMTEQQTGNNTQGLLATDVRYDRTNTQGNIHKNYWLQNLDMTEQTHRETNTGIIGYRT